jgi:hypothetical protein
MFLPQCERQTFTQVQNDRQNYSSVYYKAKLKSNGDIAFLCLKSFLTGKRQTDIVFAYTDSAIGLI